MGWEETNFYQIAVHFPLCYLIEITSQQEWTSKNWYTKICPSPQAFPSKHERKLKLKERLWGRWDFLSTDFLFLSLSSFSFPKKIKRWKKEGKRNVGGKKIGCYVEQLFFHVIISPPM